MEKKKTLNGKEKIVSQIVDGFVPPINSSALAGRITMILCLVAGLPVQ